MTLEEFYLPSAENWDFETQSNKGEDFLFLEAGTNQSMFKNKQICIQLYLHTVHYKLWSLYKFPPRPACVFKGTSDGQTP